ncbi:TetR family transcriptional regulator [Paenibacillus pectinilyticus]|uniref:TetR family transcriptional regulator n=1 Tax=Paenibacillus pectinilyticus TaxID=512399 RepID=A0A1C0ZY14_9BACL|nr:TetR/AcrR family transcriptional regulator [Paenibacillus pectinilyticus]OCT12991.1 TetR family transcriptional regulator [Paenibacillus pectinilyticus]
MSPRNIEKDLLMREERKKFILDSAVQVIATKGIGSTHMNDIAAAASISIGNLYHYFKSKDEIYAELLYMTQTDYGLFVTAASQMPGNAIDKLRYICSTWLSISTNWAFTILIQTARTTESIPLEIRNAVTERFTANLQPVAAIMKEGQESGHILDGEDPLELAFYFVSLIQGLTLQRAPGIEVRITPKTESIIRLFQVGFKK